MEGAKTRDTGGCAADGSAGCVNGEGGQESGRSPCAAERCDRQSRPDSRYCCDRCGVLSAEALLAEAIKHSLEERMGIEQGHRLREIKELKTRKHEVGREQKMFCSPFCCVCMDF